MTPAPWLVTGASGQVGRALLTELKARGIPAIGVDRSRLDLSRPEELVSRLQALGPLQGILNPAAYTAVDRAESEPELALRVNAQAPAVLARFCFEHGLPFVHYSTDYVYSGQGSEPWTEDSPIAPLSVYGRTKAQGDEAIQALALEYGQARATAGPRAPRFLILRTSWVYDGRGENFPKKILARAATQPELKVVDDQSGAPTHARHLAQATLDALTRLNPQNSGVYHACSTGETTWFGFAKALVARAHEAGAPLQCSRITPVATEAFPTPARRPRNSRLSLAKLQDAFGIRMPAWTAGLDLFFEEWKPGA